MSKPLAKQALQVLDYLETHKTLNTIEAVAHLNCLRLPNRIGEIIKSGIPVKKEWVNVGSTSVMEYSLRGAA